MRTYCELGFVALPSSAVIKTMRVCVPRLRMCAVGALVALALGVSPAAAQFVCDSDAAGESGDGATAGGGGNVACGTNANAAGNLSSNTATGNQADASGDNSSNTAAGAGANASGNLGRNIANGVQANASGTVGVNAAFGRSANASGNVSSNAAYGNQANASGDNSRNIASGSQANASGAGSSNIAIGDNSNASGAGTVNTAVGAGSVATGANASAFGAGASATFANSAAFGTGATATRANQQVFGTAANTYTMGGITSAASRAAQTGPLQFVTSDGNGNLATQSAGAAGLASTADIGAINTQLDELNSRISTLTTESRRGIAATAALTSAVTPSAPGRTTFSMNGSLYRSEAGIGVGFAHRFNGAFPLIVHGSYGNGGGTEHVGRLGFTVEF